MLTLQRYKVKKEFGKHSRGLSDHLYHSTDAPEFLLKKNAASEKKAGTGINIIKRASPFLLTALLLPVVFVFLLVQGSINKWLLSFLFTCLEINILFTDFALWNYYEGKKILRIWFIEMFLILIGVYFIKDKLF